VRVTLGSRDDLHLQPGAQVWLVIKTYSCHLVAG
jgi:ABC-type molybdate transport system ATPase subunit